MSITTQLSEIVPFQQKCIFQWKKNGIKLNQEGLLRLIEENHSFNFQLWDAEDRARRDDLGFEWVYDAKREIDQYNQQRNNRMEDMDKWLFAELKPSTQTDCPVHSETPGMMIDRVSILSLKHYHMNLQTIRTDVDDAHHQTCQMKCYIIAEQQKQLLLCLQELLREIITKKRTFRLYHQLKMYNDPTLNPFLSRAGISVISSVKEA